MTKTTIARIGKRQKILLFVVGIGFLIAFNLLFFFITIPLFIIGAIVMAIGRVYVWRRYTGIKYERTDAGDLMIHRRRKSFRIPREEIVGMYDNIPDDFAGYTIVDRYATNDQGIQYIVTTTGLVIPITPRNPEIIQ